MRRSGVRSSIKGRSTLDEDSTGIRSAALQLILAKELTAWLQKARRTNRYQMKVTLNYVDPPIWRRFSIPAHSSLYSLHLTIQGVMGWENYHLYEFEIKGTSYGEPQPDYDLLGNKMKDAAQTSISRATGGRRKGFLYRYDFGDDWEHTVEIEKHLQPDASVRYPICIEGERACPPEDCGCIWGYSDLIEIMQNPRHLEYEERMGWLGGELDPEKFDVETVNRDLQGMPAAAG